MGLTKNNLFLIYFHLKNERLINTFILSLGMGEHKSSLWLISKLNYLLNLKQNYIFLSSLILFTNEPQYKLCSIRKF